MHILSSALVAFAARVLLRDPSEEMSLRPSRSQRSKELASLRMAHMDVQAVNHPLLQLQRLG
eukprot:6867747-Pyramimonas_sp.AAC.1